MAVDPGLLEILICPVCQGDVSLQGEAGLECAGCHRVYPVRDGIPVMLEDEASRPGPVDEPAGPA